MKISTKGRYALRMLIDLAEHQNCGYIPLGDIAKRQNISKKYLEQIIPILGGANILRTTRGAQGGYMLSRTPESYTVGEILRLTEGSLSPLDDIRLTQGEYEETAEVVLLTVWQGLSRVVSQYLDSISLQDMVEMRQEQYMNNYMI